MTEKTPVELMNSSKTELLNYIIDLINSKTDDCLKYVDLQNKLIDLQKQHLKLLSDHLELKKLMSIC